jgi:uncharacterized repeat protein (TIGR01451 family)
MNRSAKLFALLLVGLIVIVASTNRASQGSALYSNNTTFLPVITHTGQQVQPSKVAYVIHERLGRVATARQAAGAGEMLSPATVEALSDSLIKVNSASQMRLAFHSQQAITPALVSHLQNLGSAIEVSTADIIWPDGMSAPPGLGIVVAWVPYDQVLDAAQADWVTAATTVEENPPDEGAFLSEGVALHGADDLNTLGIDGSGVTIGAISDGVTNMADAQASGDLPATVTIPAGCAVGSGDEGTAMLEIIHDMAPGAALLYCATGGGGVLSHVAAQNNLVVGGADVIAEDIPFDAEPAFQQGLAAINGDAVAAIGVSMHSSAGNRGNQHAARVTAVGTGGGPDGVAGPFAGCPLTPDNVVAIAPNNDTTFDITVQPGTTGTTLVVTLQWSEPRAIFPTAGAGGFTDLNLYVMDAALTQCLASSVGVQGNGAGDTIEQIVLPFPAGPNVNVKIVVDVESVNGAVAPPLLDLRWRGRTANIDAPTRDGSLNPDSNYTGLATSSAAANAGVSTDPTTVPLEGFSSGGPVQLWLTTVCPGGIYPCPGTSVAGPPLTTADAPAWTAADGVAVSGAGGFGAGTCPAVNQGDCRFFGTSAAAPHAAACDVLVRQNMGAAATVAAVNARLAVSAIDRGPAGFDTAWGAGVLDCLGAAIQGDLVLTKSASPDPVTAGTTLTYLLAVTNDGPDDVPDVVVTDTLPAGVTFISSPDGCVETGPGSGIVTCSLASLANGANASFTIHVVVDADLVYNNGGPVTITNQATVTGIGFDPDPSNNDATEDTLVVAEADLEIIDFAVVDAPAEVLIGEEVTLTFAKQIVNNGPSAPIDTELTLTAVAPAGSMVTPTLDTLAEMGLALGVPRLVTETFTVNCGQPGNQTFTFANEIQPLHPADTDPDQSNNTAAIDVTVECIIPVAINIKPGSFPNAIHPGNQGVIPVAVLTTLAGEYNLPLDFDATLIDPLSVRFGPREAVWNETGGAFEAHGMGHLEDSYELDEVTQDGDLDMVLHFHTPETGIQHGDTEACVKGLWQDGGNVFKFFGCDSVWTVPPSPP